MALDFYDENNDLYVDEFFTHHDGRLGGAYEKLIKIRNSDVTRYYTNVTLSYLSTGYQEFGEFGTNGWSIKFIYGTRQPTEAEWDEVRSGEPLDLPDIGTVDAADTFQYHPVWVRVYCPGATPVQRKKNQKLRITYYEKLVVV